MRKINSFLGQVLHKKMERICRCIFPAYYFALLDSAVNKVNQMSFELIELLKIKSILTKKSFCLNIPRKIKNTIDSLHSELKHLTYVFWSTLDLFP